MQIFKRKVRNTRSSAKKAARPAKVSSRKESASASKVSNKKNQESAQKSGKIAALKQKFAHVDWGIFRINFVVLGFVGLWVVLWGRAWYWQVLEGSRLADKASKQYVASVLVTGKRGVITDRNGQVLARSVEARSVYARPKEIKDPVNTANVLAPILNIPAQKLYAQISSSERKFIWLTRKVDDQTALAVRTAALSGIGLSKEYSRVYPFKQMAGQLLGFVGVDDQGLEGIERAFDSHLASVPTRRTVQRDAMGRRFFLHSEGETEPGGKDLQLTLDTQVQFFAEEVIAETVEENNASWGGVLVVDIESGGILAWAQYPFFNPNAYRMYAASQYKNRLASDALEPGSTLKPFLVGAALQENLVTSDTIFDCENGRWDTLGTTIRDTSVRGELTVDKIIRYSSNIGVSKIGQVLGAPMYHKYLSRLGFGERTEVPVSESRGILRHHKDWAEVDLLSTSFGQSLSVTSLQLAQAYLTLANNGVYKPLRLVMNREEVEVLAQAKAKKAERIYSSKVSKEVMRMLRDVVEEDGSGKRARIEGIEVAGKTGTSQKADKKTGKYGDERLASFVGFAPAENPRYLTLVMVDEPKKNQFGGVVAAPVFQKITRLAMIYGGHLPDVVFASADGAILKRGTQLSKQARSYKISRSPVPVFAQASFNAKEKTTKQITYNTLPGRLTKGSAVVPDVVGKTVRNAVELFARGGVVPVLKGQGQRVVRQSPAPGSDWSPEKREAYVLWLSEM